MADKSEKTQRGNPHQLTVRQHVFPAKSIARFAEGGVVELYDLIRAKVRRARADDGVFCAARAWNHGAEHGFMKKIEVAFQELVRRISPADRPKFDSDHIEVISEFFGLWSARARWRRLPQQTIKPSADILGTRVEFTEDDLELLERNKIGAVRPDGSIAMRDIVATRIRLEVDHTRDTMAGRQWGALTAADGEFCVPDTPSFAIIPISPVMILAADGPSEVVDRDEVHGLNGALLSGAREYVFARSLDACPGLQPLLRNGDY